MVLDQAAELEARVMRGDDEPWLERCLERLGAHREILARRAGNVALAPVVTAEELTELRQACSRLYALQGAIARKLGGLRHLS